MNNLAPPNNKNQYGGILKAVIIIFVLLVLWNFVGPLIGFAAILSAGALTFLLGLLILIGLGCILAPILACAGSIAIGVAVLILAIVGIVLFPILWPFIIPIFIILVIIRLVARK